MKQLIARIDDDLHAQFKAACALTGENMTRLIEDWIRQYLESREMAADVAAFDKGVNEPGGRPLRDIMKDLTQEGAAHV